MLGVTSLSLNQVRSHKKAEFHFTQGMNAIVGPNGSGKTTVLEALYTLMKGSSFRGSIGELAQYGSNEFQMLMNLTTPATTHKRSLGYQQVGSSALKKWMIDEKKYTRLPIARRLPVVLFEPDLGRLITGSPERRRQYLDHIAAQLSLEAAQNQSRFERTLRQRNQLLKKLSGRSITQTPDELFVWDTQLVHLSEQIVLNRLKVIDALREHISTYYRQLGGVDEVFLTYASSVGTDPAFYAARLQQFLETSLPRDLALGYTSFGPHRDDLEIHLADQLAVERASRGEIRSMVLACKLLEAELLAQHFMNEDLKPVLLLDDVLSELDLVHQERVLEGFKDYQVFITTTDAHTLTPGTHTIALS